MPLKCIRKRQLLTPSVAGERCLRVFADAAAHAVHVAGATPCTPPPAAQAQLGGLSHAQARALKRKVYSGAGDAENWFAVWDIVFPGTARPESVYVDGEVSADLCEFREYCSRHGAAVLWGVLDEAGLWDLPAREREKRGKRLLDDGLNVLYETWRGEGDAEPWAA